MLDLTQNYFAVFELDPVFGIDVEQLTSRYREIQAQVHPDRFADKGDHEKRLALQYTAFINEAYQCLKQPLERARYLLSLSGADAGSETQSHTDSAFLMEQIELREKLESITQQPEPESAFGDFYRQVAKKVASVQQEFLQHFEAHQFSAAKNAIEKWQFLVKLQNDARKLEEQFDDDNS